MKMSVKRSLLAASFALSFLTLINSSASAAFKPMKVVNKNAMNKSITFSDSVTGNVTETTTLPAGGSSSFTFTINPTGPVTLDVSGSYPMRCRQEFNAPDISTGTVITVTATPTGTLHNPSCTISVQ